VTLVDASPLVALALRSDPDHARCVQTAMRLQRPFLTTWAAITEAMYLLHRQVGWPAQDQVWALIERGNLQLGDLSPASTMLARELMQRYRDLPMDLADATLVALAEERGLRRIFTLDGAFYVYRLNNGLVLNVIP